MRLNVEPVTEQSQFWEQVNILAKEAFPPEEYLAPSELVEMAQSDNFDFLALLDGDTFVGFMVVMLYENMAYLFFLAIDENSRGQGYGSRAIETLKEEYPDKIHTVVLRKFLTSLPPVSTNNASALIRRGVQAVEKARLRRSFPTRCLRNVSAQSAETPRPTGKAGRYDYS